MQPLAQADESAALAVAFSRVMTSLEDLATSCRAHGINPMTALMTMMSSTGSTGAAGTSVLPQVIAPCSEPSRASDSLTDGELIAFSRELIDALDRCDVPCVATALALGFVHVAAGTARDRDATLMRLIERAPEGRLTAARVWVEERVIRKHDVLVFMGRAREELAGNETKGGYVRDGWYALQWVRAGETWRAQLLSWEKEETEREYFNGVFLNGRGFSREPNRLLVEVIANEKPGDALDLATGQGRNALYLAAQGWNVTGVDGAEEGLRIAREVAAERGLTLETVHADIDEWDLGVNRFDLVTLMYAGDHARWIDKIKTSLRVGGLFVVEGWGKVSSQSHHGFDDGQLARLFDGYDILRDEIVADDVPDWASDKGKLVRFVARKKYPSTT